MFIDHPDQIYVPVKARSLVIADGRVLHASLANQTDQRRTLMLSWYGRPNTVPDYWTGDVPKEIADRDPNATYPGTRIPGEYLK